MSKGKGNKLISISSARAADRIEYVVCLTVIGAGDGLRLQSGKRALSLKAKDLAHYQGERGRRGNKLPRGFQRVEAMECLPSVQAQLV